MASWKHNSLPRAIHSPGLHAFDDIIYIYVKSPNEIRTLAFQFPNHVDRAPAFYTIANCLVSSERGRGWHHIPFLPCSLYIMIYWLSDWKGLIFSRYVEKQAGTKPHFYSKRKTRLKLDKISWHTLLKLVCQLPCVVWMQHFNDVKIMSKLWNNKPFLVAALVYISLNIRLFMCNIQPPPPPPAPSPCINCS